MDNPTNIPAKPLFGVLPVFQTPYHDDESIDWGTLEHELHWLIERGANGVVMAMVSEVLRLSTAERREMAEFVCRTLAGKAPVVISTSAESTHSAVALARHAEAAGAAAVMLIPPISTALGPDAVTDYFRRVVQAVAIPVIIQDASGYVGKPLPIDVQAGLLHEFGPQRVMYKPEGKPIGPNLSALRDATAGKALIFEGTGGISLVDNFRRGVMGTMPGADQIDAIVALWRALQAGDERRIYQLSLPLCSLVTLQVGLDGFLAVEKHLLKRQGIFKNTVVRGPVGWQMDDETRQEVDRVFDLLTKATHDR